MIFTLRDSNRLFVALGLATMIGCSSDDSGSDAGGDGAASDALVEGAADARATEGGSDGMADGASSGEGGSGPNADGGSGADGTTPPGQDGGPSGEDAQASSDAGAGTDDTGSAAGGSDATLADVTFQIGVDATVQTVNTLCAAIISFVAAPSEVDVGYPIPLTALGIDPQGQLSDVVLTWAAQSDAGTLSATTGMSTSFRCTAPGTATVTVTATVADGGISCPGSGSQTVTLTCNAVPDASVADAGDDSADAETDAGENAADSQAEAEAQAEDAADVAVEAAPTGPQPCMGANDAPDCVQCFGNTNDVCSATEAIIVARDVAKGNLTAAGQLAPFASSSPDAGSCYACLNNFFCIDNTLSGPGQECGDLPSSAKTLDGEPVAQECLDTLQCIVSSKCTTSNPPDQCFCGTADGKACLTAGAANGPCLQQEIDGLGVGKCTSTYPAALSCTEGDPTNTQKAFTNVNLPAGMANVLLGCAFDNCKAQCTP